MAVVIDFAGYTFAEHKAAFACKHVRNGLPVLLFVHDSDGDVHFMCGSGHGLDDVAVVGLSHLLEHIRAIADMPTVQPGFLAERDEPGAPWKIQAAAD